VKATKLFKTILSLLIVLALLVACAPAAEENNNNPGDSNNPGSNNSTQLEGLQGADYLQKLMENELDTSLASFKEIYAKVLEGLEGGNAMNALTGGKMDLNLYFAGKNAIADFVSGQDLVISFFDVGGGHPTFGLSKGGGEIPWYVHELPVVGISVNKPTMLADAPMLRTYINTYDSNDDTLDALVDALMEGPAAFKGSDPIDAYCGMYDTHM
jgi:hypothetical protein